MAEADIDPGNFPDLDDAELFKQFGNLCDEDLLLLTIAMEENGNAGFRIGHGPKFNLDDFTDEDMITNFRFTRDDIYKLCRLLQFPEKVTSTSRVTSTGLECLCIMLRRLAYPN